MNVTDLVFPLLLGLIAWYFLIRPQQQERAAHEELLRTLSKDDRVVTASGVHGRVVEVSADTVVVDVSDKSRITFDKWAVARKLAEAGAA